MDSFDLIAGLVFGSIGIGYLIYGRRQHAVAPFVAGLGLIAFPYLVSGRLATLAIGIGLMLLPVIVRRIVGG